VISRVFSEADLARVLMRQARTLFPAIDRVETEVPSRLGIADVVLVRTNRRQLDRRLASQLAAVLTQSAAQVLVEVVAGHVAATPPRLRGQLQASGHIVRGIGELALAPALLDAYLEIIAIEVKLDDWRRADAQAERYRTYADRAYVALPAERITPAVRAFYERGAVGLIAVGAPSEIVVAARIDIPAEAWRRVLVSEVLSARLMESQRHRATLGMSVSRYPRAATVPTA
jgi:hypothetical protein